MKGVCQHCGHSHLHRYLVEFDFRYNNRTLELNDSGCAERFLRGVKGSRLTNQTNCSLNMAGAKGKPRKRKPKTEPEDKVQLARFIEAAKVLEVEEGLKAFQRALDTLLPK
jgi:hypothetical protein